ncbi:MAG: leucine-rich repeat domain-containing protein [Saprospiraceae bacterium]
MSRRYALRFYAFDDRQSIVPLPMKAGQVTLTSEYPDLHIWAEPVRRLRKAKENGGWPENLDWPTDNQPPANEAQESVIVLFVRTAALAGGPFFQELIRGSTGLRRIEPLLGGEAKPARSPDYRPSPIITISLENAMALHEESAGLDCDPSNTKPWKEQREKSHRLYNLGIDHRVKFLDSSIWHRYVAFDAGFEKNLFARLSDVVTYSDLRLYRSLASLASLEFQCRMLLNSFIVALGANGHHDAVTPFKFHSETWMARQSERIMQFLRAEGEEMQLIDLQWNALMVDDQADEPISTIDDEGKRPASLTESGEQPPAPAVAHERDPALPPTKRALIARWLNQDAAGTAGKMLNVQTENCTTGEQGIIAQGIQILRKQTCDVIFLDYLLGKGETLRANGREYGHEFLLELVTGQQQLHRGPLGRYWIFPISSFPFAFTDKLRQLGMEGVSDRWYISEGGDPIATPEMFRFNFLRMALLQISECYLYPAAMVRLVERFAGIQGRKEWGGAVRTALEVREVNQKLLATDQTQKSMLAHTMRSFLKKQKCYERQVRHLKVLAILLERPLNAARYRSIWKVQTEFGENMTSHPAKEVLHEKMIVLLSEVNEKHKVVIRKISEAIESIELDLSDLGILDLPPMISQCTQIQRLNLSGNRLDSLPSEMFALTHLVHLDLAGNDFSKPPTVLKNLPALEWLDLRDNPNLGALADVYEDEIDIKMRLSMAIEQEINNDSAA